MVVPLPALNFSPCRPYFLPVRPHVGDLTPTPPKNSVSILSYAEKLVYSQRAEKMRVNVFIWNMYGGEFIVIESHRHMHILVLCIHVVLHIANSCVLQRSCTMYASYLVNALYHVLILSCIRPEPRTYPLLSCERQGTCNLQDVMKLAGRAEHE